jgi:hypothetical protein
LTGILQRKSWTEQRNRRFISMPCSQGDTTLTATEIDFIIGLLKEKPLSDVEVTEKMSLPLFKVRSKLRELVQLEYLEKKNEKYSINRLK